MRLLRRTLARIFAALAMSLFAVVAAAQSSAPCAIDTRSIPIAGRTIAYNVAGSGPTVLLIHGLFADKEQWNALAQVAVRYPAQAKTLVFLGSPFGVESWHPDDFLKTAANAPNSSGLANPASQNCGAKGGTLTIEKNAKGDQFGVCLFADNMQCEEWAMLRGDCRTGGIKVTGYVTPAARYCAIAGGTYAITSGSNTPKEHGTCTFKDGKSCDASAYFAGTCPR
ncbi:MAG: DUF333 domain-containing protein [Burkholderiales bacterium]